LPDDQEFLTANASHAAVISPDGKWVAYAANNQLFLRPMAETEARPIAGRPDADNAQAIAEPFFSSDSQWIAYYAREDATLKKIAIGGGAPVTLCKTDSISGGYWAGEQIYFARLREKGIMRVSANGGEPQEIVPRSKPTEVLHGPQPINGGQSILYTASG